MRRMPELIARGGGLERRFERHFRDHRHERQFLSSVGFFVAFAVARAVTHTQRARARQPHKLWLGKLGPLGSIGQRRHPHRHHLVWGILLLLANGYAWLFQFGTGHGRSSRRASRLTSLLYGIGSALTLDEFALWLNLEDEYWAREGRESIDAVALFGALLSAGLWGEPLWRELARGVTRPFRGY